MRITNIQWDVDFEEAWQKLKEMDYDESARIVGCPIDHWANMETQERYDYAYEYFHCRPGEIIDFLEIPDEVEIPAEIAEDPEYANDWQGLVEYISDWLSDEYGYCHEGFEIDPEDKINRAMEQDCEVTADVMAELLMDTDWSTWKMFEGIASDYLNGNKDVRKGIDLAISALTGWNMSSIATKILERVDEEAA